MTKGQAIRLLVVLIGGLVLATVVSRHSVAGAAIIAALSFMYFTYGKGGHSRIGRPR